MSLLHDLLVLTPKLITDSVGSKRSPILSDLALLASQELQKPHILRLRTQGCPSEQMLEECERYLTLSHVGIKGLMGSGKLV